MDSLLSLGSGFELWPGRSCVLCSGFRYSQGRPCI